MITQNISQNPPTRNLVKSRDFIGNRVHPPVDVFHVIEGLRGKKAKLKGLVQNGGHHLKKLEIFKLMG